MFKSPRSKPRFPLIHMTFLLASITLLLNCIEHRYQDNYPDTVPVALFIDMARQSGCHDLRNKLFIIDQNLVFWDRAGTCTDNAFSQRLFSNSTNTILCERYDSVGGVVTHYNDVRYRDLFNTITANLDHSNLGLAWPHTVQEIRF